MVRGIGIDSVEITRFDRWLSYSPKKLLRLLSKKEIDYCLRTKKKSAERFAARFAAKEALFKAISSLGIKIPFLTMCRKAHLVQNTKGAPQFILEKNFLKELNSPLIQVTITHTKTTATAFVILT